MELVYLNFGSEPLALAALVPIISSIGSAEIHLVNIEIPLTETYKLYFWSTLSLHKSYLLMPEIGTVFNKISVSSVLDINNTEKIRAIVKNELPIYFSINLTRKQIVEYIPIIASIIEYRESLNYLNPLILIVIQDNGEYQSFYSAINSFAAKSDGKIKLSLENVYFLNIFSDILCSFPQHNLDKSILHCEETKGTIAIDHRGTPIFELYPEFETSKHHIKTQINNLRKAHRVIETDINHGIKKYYQFQDAYMKLIAISADNANYGFIKEYLKEEKQARVVSDGIIKELSNCMILTYDFQKDEFLKKFSIRLRNFGGDVIYILPLDKDQLKEIYDDLSSFLQPLISLVDEHWKEKPKIIPYLLKLLKAKCN